MTTYFWGGGGEGEEGGERGQGEEGGGVIRNFNDRCM